jgi:UDP-glucose 4-epimerase
MKPLHPKNKKPPKILVTGANGFIGRALCQNFERNSILHSQLFRPSQKKNVGFTENSSSTIVFGDLLDLPSLRAACRGIDIVVHTAGIAHVSDAGGKTGRSVNKDGTTLLLGAALEAGVKRFIYVSSSLAGQKQIHGKNTTTYGQDKLIAETQILKEAKAKKIEAIILRPVNVYGVGMKGNLLNFSKLVGTGFMPRLPDFKGKFSLVSVNDVATALTLALNCELSGPQVLTLTDGHSYTINEIEVELRKANNLKLPRVKLPATLLSLSFIIIVTLTKLKLIKTNINLTTYRNLTRSNELSNLRAKEVLDFKPSTSFYDILPEITAKIRNKS